jgi:hypothetical protein
VVNSGLVCLSRDTSACKEKNEVKWKKERTGKRRKWVEETND